MLIFTTLNTKEPCKRKKRMQKAAKKPVAVVRDIVDLEVRCVLRIFITPLENNESGWIIKAEMIVFFAIQIFFPAIQKKTKRKQTVLGKKAEMKTGNLAAAITPQKVSEIWSRLVNKLLTAHTTAHILILETRFDWMVILVLSLTEIELINVYMETWHVKKQIQQYFMAVTSV